MEQQPEVMDCLIKGSQRIDQLLILVVEQHYN